MLRTFLLIGCFAIGWFFPGLNCLRPLMGWMLFYMVQVVFLRMEFVRGVLTWRHGVILVLNIALAFLFWGVCRWIGLPERFAQAAFFTAITPTATSSPVIVGALGGRVSFETAGFLLSALVLSALYPVLIPFILNEPLGGDTMGVVFKRVGYVTLLPLVLALVARTIWGEKAKQLGRKLMGTTLYVWMALVIVIAANASYFIRTNLEGVKTSDVLIVLVIDILVAIVSFGLGAIVGGRAYRRECSQMLGQKNTSYTTILAMMSGHPFVALGPAFYVFFHNAWNGIQLWMYQGNSDHEKR